MSDDQKEDKDVKTSFSQWFISYIQERRRLPDVDDSTTNCYVREWVKEIFRIYRSVGDMKVIIDYIAERGMMDCVVMDTILNDLRMMVKCSQLSEETRNMLAVEDNAKYRKWVNSMAEKFDDPITKKKYFNMCRKLRKILQRVILTIENIPVDQLLVEIFNLKISDAYEKNIHYKINKNKSKKKKIKLKWIYNDKLADGAPILPDIEGILENHGVVEFESVSEAISALGVSKDTFYRFVRYVENKPKLEGERSKLKEEKIKLDEKKAEHKEGKTTKLEKRIAKLEEKITKIEKNKPKLIKSWEIIEYS